MELYFLLLLVSLMVAALSAGFPVAFSLPGSAILTIAIAALCGYLFAGDPDAFFVNGGPTEWLNAGVTNFRSLYWIVERDTLIAIPLFIFMGIMLQRSKIAEDLLVAMAQLFGPVPGGLGISVVFVGALLAATTGIVGATVIAMGLISLPAMLRNNYSKPLACGTICASGTLGQIIPPSIVLIILADQLSSAADQANTLRKADYKAMTGEFSMPSQFDVVSASAGDMFMGAFIPGLILVGLYMLYIFVSALIKPENAPPVPYEGAYDRKFLFRVFMALTPPLLLIFVVLGSIVLGVATVNQAGAVGAIGALLMGSYRLAPKGNRHAYTPAILAILSIVVIGYLQSGHDLNIKSISNDSDRQAIYLAMAAVAVLLFAVGWSIVRAWRTENILSDVMMDTAKTTSMVFIILIGAAMLTSAFRAFGGEELVKHYLTSLPGGFWVQFMVVMLVIFLLGFFLDFIEIAVVVVPIVAPILLADPQANVTAVWLGVMVGLNIQTSFLTPPFGFALFYLRGVAPDSVKTTHIYKGAVAFIVLQLVGLAIAGAFPSLVNYLPNRTHLTSETAPPPNNPKLQLCLEDMVFEQYGRTRPAIEQAVSTMKRQDLTLLPEQYRQNLQASLQAMEDIFDRVAAVDAATTALQEYQVGYQPLHRQVRDIERDILKLGQKIKRIDNRIKDIRYSEEPDDAKMALLQQQIEQIERDQQTLKAMIPEQWADDYQQHTRLAKAEQKARRLYRQSVDDSYQAIVDLRDMMSSVEDLQALQPQIEGLRQVIREQPQEQAIEQIKSVSAALSPIKNAHTIKSKLSKARRVLKKKQDRDQAESELNQALDRLQQEMQWRQQAGEQLLQPLAALDEVVKGTIGLRMQPRFTVDQAENIAACLSVHRDISLSF